ncbi:CBS domain-containing protein [Myxococcota bacterium]
MEKLKVRDIMSTDLVTLKEDDDLGLAENVMRFGRIRHLPVVTNGKLVGLVTHRDILRAQVSSLADLPLEDRNELKLSIPAREIMKKDIETISPDETVLDAAKILKENKYGCLPVVNNRKLIGIITEADFIDLVIRALENQ